MTTDKTYIQALNDIEELKKRAENLRVQEFGPTIERFKKAISIYGIQPSDVFTAEELSQNQPLQNVFAKPTQVAQAAPAVSSNKQNAVGAASPKYISANGETWGGHGRRPQWFVDAIAKGASKESMLFTPTHASSVPKAPTTDKRTSVPPKYISANGTMWSGRGRTPLWFAEAVAGGQTPESLMIGNQNGTQANASHAPAAAPVHGAQLMERARAERKQEPVVAQQKKPRKTGPGYRLGDRSWTGVGPRPGWIKDAIASGKTLEQLQA